MQRFIDLGAEAVLDSAGSDQIEQEKKEDMFMKYQGWMEQYYFFVSEEVIKIIGYGIYDLFYGSGLTTVSNSSEQNMKNMDMDRFLRLNMLLYYSIITYFKAWEDQLKIDDLDDSINMMTQYIERSTNPANKKRQEERKESLNKELDEMLESKTVRHFLRVLEGYEQGRLESLVLPKNIITA